MDPLAGKAMSRLHLAFRPKTSKAYSSMFRVFIAFCIYMKVALHHLSVKVILAFLECLVCNKVSPAVLANYVAAIKAKCILYNLSYHVCANVKIKYFLKSVKITRPLCVKPHNIIDLKMLKAIISECRNLRCGPVFKAIFLPGFFGFLRLSNLSPHSASTFDPSRHLTGSDVFFTKKHVKLLLKWSKTIQTRDRVEILTLPKLTDPDLCPRSALKVLFDLYQMSTSSSLFQIYTVNGWVTLIDSRVRKVLSKINVALGLHPNHFTFHSLRRSGATFAFNAHVPIQDIKRQGTWTSECVWKYIQADHSSGEKLANSLATVINV